MSEEVTRDVKNIWKRLFDHTHFLKGEINLIVNEFEVKREDKEVNELFRIVESLTDLKEAQIGKVQVLDHSFLKVNEKLSESLAISKRIIDLEGKYKKDSILTDSKNNRKIIWNKFMDDITEQYSEIDSLFEQKEKSLKDCLC